jgi:lipopolysaccharide transport system ATP-binding protein
MSSILRLTEESLVLEKGKVLLRALPRKRGLLPEPRTIQAGRALLGEDEVPASAAPFRPLAIRVRAKDGSVSDTVRSVEPFTIEIEYALTKT